MATGRRGADASSDGEGLDVEGDLRVRDAQVRRADGSSGGQSDDRGLRHRGDCGRDQCLQGVGHGPHIDAAQLVKEADRRRVGDQTVMTEQTHRALLAQGLSGQRSYTGDRGLELLGVCVVL